ncbi:hypothetical protein ACS0TY_014954 [Phlomoides rotata]
MKAPPKHTQFFLILTLFFSYVYSQSQDSCTSPLTLQSPLPFDTSSLHCVSVWGSENFILRYGQEQGGANVWNFVLSAPNTNGYIGMGFSPNGNMVGSDAVVGWVGSDGASDIKKFHLGGQQPNLVTLQSTDAGLQVANSSTRLQSQPNNRIYISFQLLTGQPTSRLIYAVGRAAQLPVAPNFRLTQHRDMITTVLNYESGQFETTGSPYASLRRSHGLLNMFGWAILLPIGAMVARYMRKWDPLWFYSHAAIQTSGFILGLSGVVCGLILDNRIKANVSKHKALGIIIFTLGCLQILALLIRPDKAAKVRKYWNWYHFGVGRILILLASINVFYGIHLGGAGSSWNVGFAAFLVIIFIITLIMELRMCLRK